MVESRQLLTSCRLRKPRVHNHLSYITNIYIYNMQVFIDAYTQKKVFAYVYSRIRHLCVWMHEMLHVLHCLALCIALQCMAWHCIALQYVCLYVGMYACVHVYMCTCVHVFLCSCVCIYVCMSVGTYACMPYITFTCICRKKKILA